MKMDMDGVEELSRKLTMLEARLASYERLHAEELLELRSMLQELRMKLVALQSRAAHDAADRISGIDPGTSGSVPSTPQSAASEYSDSEKGG